VILRTDHVAGGAAVAVGVIVFAISGDLPFGALAFPGAGMLPKLLCGLLIVVGLALLIRGHRSEPASTTRWGDLRHAIPVFAIATTVVAVYTTLGFILSMALMLFALALLERRPPVHAALFSISVSIGTYALFAYGLKSPLEHGLFGF
jgi:uncharacterized membrane protein